MLDDQQIEDTLIEVLEEIQGLLGPHKQRLTRNSTPMGDIEGFDSLCAIEATVILEDRLQISLGENAFVNMDGTKPLKIFEIINICRQAVKTREQHA